MTSTTEYFDTISTEIDKAMTYHQGELDRLTAASAALQHSNGATTRHSTRAIRKHGPKRAHVDRLGRAIRAIRKHGPLSPSVLGAYTGVATRNIALYSRYWSKYLTRNPTTNKYELLPEVTA